MAKAYALIRFHYGKKPENIPEQAILQLLGEFSYIRKYQVAIIEEAIVRIVTRLFGR